MFAIVSKKVFLQALMLDEIGNIRVFLCIHTVDNIVGFCEGMNCLNYQNGALNCAGEQQS